LHPWGVTTFKMNFKESPATNRILVEMNALQAALTCIDDGRPLSDAALASIKEVQSFPVVDNEMGWVAQVARAHVLSEEFEPVRFPLVEDGQADTRMFTYLARAWSCWAAGDIEAAKVLLKALDEDEDAHIPGGHLHVMALDAWSQAIEALLDANPKEARRYYRRAIEAGSQFGTWTNNAVQWTYVASFLEHDELNSTL